MEIKNIIRDESHLFDRVLTKQIAPAVLNFKGCTAFGITFKGDFYVVSAKHCFRFDTIKTNLDHLDADVTIIDPKNYNLTSFTTFLRLDNSTIDPQMGDKVMAYG